MSAEIYITNETIICLTWRMIRTKKLAWGIIKHVVLMACGLNLALVQSFNELVNTMGMERGDKTLFQNTQELNI